MDSRADAVALIDRIVAAYNSRDTDALAALYTSDITYWSAIDGFQFGISTVRSHIDQLHETLPDEKIRAKTVVADGEVIVAEFESTGISESGAAYLIEFTEVLELRSGKVEAIKVYLDPEEIERILE